MNNLIKSSTGNILIFGIRRIGKTSLCLHLSKTAEKDTNILIGYLSTEIIRDLEPEVFIQSILLEIVSRTALSLFSKRYSDLLFDDLQNSHLFQGDYVKLLRLFELARSSERTAAKSSKKDIGISSLIKSGIEQNHTTQANIDELKPFEAVFLINEAVDFLKCTKYKEVCALYR